jgi:hypothetical protein
MEDLPFRIRKSLFNLTKHIQKKIYPNTQEYQQHRRQRVDEGFPRFCPLCQFPVEKDHCPVCGTVAVTPTYCPNCDITTDSPHCPTCGQKIYFRKIKADVKVKDFRVFPN